MFLQLITIYVMLTLHRLMDGGVAWMHDNTKKVDLESYLLGKRIDDFVDPTAQENTATDWVRHIFSNFKSKR